MNRITEFEEALIEALDKADPELTIAEMVGVYELIGIRLKLRLFLNDLREPPDPGESWKNL